MRTLLPILALVSTAAHAQTTYTVVASDFQFEPSELTVQAGDTVRLTLNAGHGFRQITSTAWDLDEVVPINGPDLGPFPELNTEHYLVLNTAPDTLYYICVPHADMGMKGRIIVQAGSIGMGETGAPSTALFPNPTAGTLWISPMHGSVIAARVTDGAGRLMEFPVQRDGRLEVGSLADGAYHTSFMDAQGKVLAQGRFMVRH